MIGDLVFVAAGNARMLVALDARTGAGVWSLGLSGPAYSAPILAGDLVVVGDYAGRLYVVGGPGRRPQPRSVRPAARAATGASTADRARAPDPISVIGAIPRGG